jgi:hypothetical protein
MHSHRKNFTRALLLSLLLIICGGNAFYAQEGKQDKRVPLMPTGLSLEVNTKEGPISYKSIPGEFFGGIYRRLPSWKPSSDAPDMDTFELRYVMEGDAVRVKAYAWLGKFADKKELIGNFLLQEGLKVAVEGMAKYGYEPMELTVVKVKPPTLVLPETTSRIQSVAVVGVEIKPSNFPAYKLTLRNLSAKDITHLEIRTYKDGRPSLTKWPRAEFSRPLIKAGETGEFTINSTGSGQKTQDGFIPSSPQRIEVTTAIFTDKSHEGDSQLAARFVAMMYGYKVQLTRALTLLQNDLEGQGASAAVENFRQHVSALSRDANQEMIDEVGANFAGRTPQWNEGIKAFMESGLDEVRKELLKDLDEGARNKHFGTWVSELKQKYEAWLSRL